MRRCLIVRRPSVTVGNMRGRVVGRPGASAGPEDRLGSRAIASWRARVAQTLPLSVECGQQRDRPGKAGVSSYGMEGERIVVQGP